MANHVIKIGTADLKGAITELVGDPLEGATLNDSGTIAFTDVDIGDTHTVNVVGFNNGPSNVEFALGTLTAVLTSDTANGTGGLITWVYEINADAIEYLSDGKKRVEAFDIVISDGHGSVITKTIVITINGTNDGIVVGAADLDGAVTEVVGDPSGGTKLSDSGTIEFSDVDLSDNFSVKVNENGSPLGKVKALVTADPVGGTGGLVTWTYEVAASKVEYLAAGQTKVETFDLTLKDKHGSEVTQTVSVTITGTNDGVDMGNRDLIGKVIETRGLPAPGDQLSDSGTIKFKDADVNDTHTVTVSGFNAGASNVTSALGTLTASLTSETVDGKHGELTWVYTVDAAAVEYLNKGETRVEAFDVAVDDGNGGTDTRTVVVTIKGTKDVTTTNHAPTDIVLSNATIAENSASGTVVGLLSATDADAGDTATFTLQNNAGGLFAIVGNELRVAGALDYESAPSLQVTVRVTDAGGLTFDEVITINVSNVNEAPTDIALTNDTVAENSAAGTVIGLLSAADADAGDIVTFSLQNDAGGLFAIVGNELRVAGSLNHESASSHQVTVRVTDAGGLTYDEVITINVRNVNEAPIDIALTGNTVAENAVGVTIGTLSTLDSDAGDSHAYTVDDARFEVDGNTLKLKAGQALNFEDASSIDIEVTSTDVGGLATVKSFTINVTNANDAPDSISLTSNVVNEGALGAIIGELTATDPDGDTSFTYTVDDDRFEVSSGFLKLKAGVALDYEHESQVSLAVTATDAGGASFSHGFTIDVVDGPESQAIDGYIAGATVFADANNDGVLDPGEAFTVTDASGNFILFGGTGPLVMFGGIDISTGLPFTGTMRAPEGSTVVTPLTTLVAAIAGPNATAQDIANANDQVLTGLGLAAGINLASFDPIAATVSSDPTTQTQGAAAVAAAVQIQNTIAQASSLLTGAGATSSAATTAVIAQLATQVSTQAQNSQTINLNDASVVTSVITSAATASGANATSVANTVSGAANVISASNQVVSAASTQTGAELLTTLAQVASVAQGTASTALADVGQQGTPEAAAAAETNYTGTNLSDAVAAAPVGNVLGVNGPDIIVGTANADVLEGFGGDDTLSGLGGSDTLVGGEGNDLLDGGADVDLATYSDATGGITVNMAAGSVSGAGIGTDTLLSIERIGGSNFSDSYDATGFSGASTNSGSNGTFNEFEGKGGNDTITGNGNTRVSYLNAAAGVTVNLAAGSGQGTAAGDVAGVGVDAFTGVNQIRGSNFADTLLGSNNNSGVQQFEGRGGDDFIDGLGGFDRAVYQFETSAISVNLAAGTVSGGGGNDTLRSIESIRGTSFSDTYIATGFTASSTNAGSAGTINTGAAFNEFEGMGGNDLISGNGNTRIAFYNATGAVTVDLAAGTAVGDGSVGSDSILGGVNSIAGSQFGDTLRGSNNANLTSEQFEGRAGNDTIDGRGGFDQVIYNNDPAVTSGISVDMAAGTVVGDVAVGTDTLIAVESVRGTNFADTYVATGFAGASADLPPGVTFNEFEGMGGNDTITGNGNTRISYVNATGGVTVDIAAGTAIGNGSVGTDTFTGVSRVRGSNFNDTISGGFGNNILEGQGGNDTINGRGGNDTITGGTGADTIIYADGDGADIVTDFNQGDGDLIDLTGVTSVFSLADVQAIATQAGANTFIDFGAGNSLTLNNVTLANLTAADFVFGAPGNQAPTAVSLANVIATLPENTSTAAAIHVADIIVSDDGLGTNTLSLSGADAAAFEIVGMGLFLRAGTVLDHETLASLNVTVDVDDTTVGGTPDASVPYTLIVANVNEAPVAAPDTNAGQTIVEMGAATAGSTGAFGNLLDNDTDVDAGDTKTVVGVQAGNVAGPVAGGPEVIGTYGTLIVTGNGSWNYALNDADPDTNALAQGQQVQDVFTYTMEDAGGLTSTSTLTIDITGSNDAPTDIALSNDTVSESSAPGTVVGTLSAIDPDAGDTVSFELLAGAGFPFALDGANLVVSGVLDSATPYQATVRATDANGAFYDENFTINVTDVNQAPTDIALSNNSVAENSASGAVVGILSATDSDSGDTATFTLQDNAGGRFAIVGNELRVAGSLDYESATSHQVTVRVTDAGGLFYDEAFTINVTNVNEAPTDIALSNDSIAENSAPGTVVGLLSATDPDSGDTASFMLHDNPGGLFTIIGNELRTTQPLDFETATSHQVTVRALDAGGLIYDELFTINVVNVNEAPVAVVDSSAGQPIVEAGAGVPGTSGAFGNVLANDTDPDAGDTKTVVGAEAGLLPGPVVGIAPEIIGTYGTLQLQSNGDWNYVLNDADPDTNALADLQGVSEFFTYTMQDSGGLTSTSHLTVHITGTNDTPTDIALSNDTVAENSAGGTVVGLLAATDPDAGDTATFTLQDDAGGLFAIVGNELRVAGALDFESATSHQVTVRVTDAGGQSYDEVFTINVSDEAGQTIVGDGGNNSLIGTPEDDTLQGLGGNDVLQGLAGDDILNGGPGFDRATYFDATGGIAVNLAAGTVSGAGVGNDTLLSVESVGGGAFADNFNAVGFGGGSANAGSNGTLNEFEGMGGDDVITGNGSTRVSYLGASAAVTVDIAAGTGQGTAAGDAANVGVDTFSGVNALRGSAFDDTLLGSNNNFGVEQFEGRGGSDFIDGRGGTDRASYQFEGAAIQVDLAAGTVAGGDAGGGQDALRSVEFIRGSNFDDTYTAAGFTATSTNAGSAGTNNTGAAFNEFEGLSGDDTVTGNGNTRIAFYNATGAVTVDLAAGTAVGDASVGSDTILGGVNSIVGSQFGDTLYGSDTAINVPEIFEGRGGNDTFDGRGGFDQAIYNNDPAVTTGISVDMEAGTVTGDAAVGTDTLIAIESVRGTNFADTFVATGFAGASTDLPLGATFNEFEGLGGNDTITGNGNTRLSYVSASGGVTVDIATGTATGNGSVGTDTFTGVSRVRGSNFNDTLLGDFGNNTLEGQGGNDLIDGRGGNDTLTGGMNADTFVYSDGYGADVVTDFNQAQGDKIDLTGVTGVFSLADIQAIATQAGSNTFIDFGAGNSLTLNNVTLANLAAADFVFAANTNQAPTAVSLANVIGTLPENTSTVSAIHVADIVVTDDGLGTNTLSLSGTDAASFEIVGTQLFLRAGTVLDFEALDTLSVTVSVDDTTVGSTPDASVGYSLTVTDENETPTDIALSNDTVAENSAAGIVVGSLSATDVDGGDTATFTLQDDAGGLFAIVGNELRVAGALDYETATSHEVTVRVTDAGGLFYDEVFTINVSDVAGQTVVGDANDNNLMGVTPEGDTIQGLGGDDMLQGLGGDDILDGGAGRDTAVFADATGGLTIDLGAGTVSGAGTGSDTLLSIENIVGSDFNDSFNASTFSPASPNAGSSGTFNVFEGRGGDDSVTGNNSTVVSYAGAAAGVTVDLLTGTGQGTDAGDVAGVGTDTFTGGVFGVFGSAHDDILRGNNSNNQLRGNAGNDILVGRGGFDLAVYASLIAAQDTATAGITVNLAAGTVVGGDASVGNDTLISVEAIRGTNHADTYDATGFSGASTNAGSSGTFNEFEGMGGDDTITGNGNTRLLFQNATGGVTVNLAAGTVSGDASVGNDTITGGVTQVIGSAFNDTLIGFDNVFGVTNSFEGRGGDDTIDGQGGFDQAIYGNDFATTSGITVNMAAGTVTGDASIGTDTLIAVESVTGTNFADTYDATGFAGASLDIGRGASFNEFQGLGGDDIITGNGNTRVSYVSAGGSVTVDLAAGTASGGGQGNDTILGGVSEVRGSNFNDNLSGSDNASFTLEIFEGRRGNDTIDGRGGMDRAVYNVDFSTASGITVDMAAGTVTGDITIGTDTLISVESVRGTSFADTYVATGFADASIAGSVPATFNEFEGLGGDDVITGNGGTKISYLSAAARVTVDIAAGTGAGTDAGDFAGIGSDNFTGVNSIRGSAYDDTLLGSNLFTGVEFFEGGAGDDFIDGRGGFDRASYALRTDDNVTGGITVDMAAGTVVGDASVGTDTLRSIEALRGTNFGDVYDATGFGLGGALNIGNNGNFNEFEGMGGDDIITGNGNTRIAYINAEAGVTVDLAAGTASGDASVGNDTITGGVTQIIGSLYDDLLQGFDNVFGIANVFDGRSGNDTFDGRGGYDQAVYNFDTTTASGIAVDMAAGTVTGDASVGTDTLISIESVTGTNFADTFVATGYTGASVDLPLGVTFNEFQGMGGDDVITGNGNTRISFTNASGAVTVDLAAGTASGDASVGNDTFTLVSRVRGSNFADTIYGDGNNNVLEGQNGNDLLDGRGGNDTLTGGANADTFVFADGYGADVVTDFTQAQADKIDLTGVTSVHNLADVQALATQNGANTVINFGGGNTLTLNNVTLGNLTAADFVFAVPSVIVGDEFDNTLTGTAANDTIQGLDGDDVLQGLGGDDILDGGAGRDTASFIDATGGLTIDLGAGTVSGAGTGNDTLLSVENIVGGDFGDSYDASTFGPASPNAGSSGNFNVFEGRGGDDAITGNGTTVVSYRGASAGVTVDLLAGTGQGTAAGDVAGVGVDTFTGGIFGVFDSSFDDSLLGDNNSNAFFAGAGDDFINGRGGFDMARYASLIAAQDTATAGITVNLAAGTVVGDASIGSDTLRSIESIRGTNHADVYDATGFSGASTNAGSSGTLNEFEGMGGDDTITGNGNTRIAFYNATGGVTVDLAAGTASGDASVGNDTITGGVTQIIGSQFGDLLQGFDNVFGVTNSFEGRGGDDTIDGRGGFDQAIYGNDFTTTSGIAVNMAAGTVVGDASIGTDTLISVESVTGTNFADTYDATGYTGASLDIGRGGTFNEFQGLGGDDIITGNGNTRISYVSAGGSVTVDLAAGTASGGGQGNDTITGGVFEVRGSNFGDTLSGTNNPFGIVETFEGRRGNDTIDGRGGFDRAIYNVDFSTASGITVDMAAGTVTGDISIGTDTLISVESVRGTNFADTYVATGFAGASTDTGLPPTFNEFEGLGGDDVITGNGNTRISFASASSGVTVDFATGTATGDSSVGTDTFTGVSRVRGSEFDDIILGGFGNNVLEGQGGNDILNGRGGNDTLTGGAGADTFVYADGYGADIVTDFNQGQGDKIDLTGVTGVHNLADVQALATQSGANTIVDFGSGNTLTLNNVTLGNLTVDDFNFV